MVLDGKEISSPHRNRNPQRLAFGRKKIAGERPAPIIHFFEENVKLEIFVRGILIADGAEMPDPSPAPLVYSVCAGYQSAIRD